MKRSRWHQEVNNPLNQILAMCHGAPVANITFNVINRQDRWKQAESIILLSPSTVLWHQPGSNALKDLCQLLWDDWQPKINWVRNDESLSQTVYKRWLVAWKGKLMLNQHKPAFLLMASTATFLVAKEVELYRNLWENDTIIYLTKAPNDW